MIAFIDREIEKLRQLRSENIDVCGDFLSYDPINSDRLECSRIGALNIDEGVSATRSELQAVNFTLSAFDELVNITLVFVYFLVEMLNEALVLMMLFSFESEIYSNNNA